MHVLDEDQDVDGWVTFGFLNEIALDDQPMMAMLAVDSTSDLGLPVLEGQLPDGTDEIAIGSSTAEVLGLEVGDSAELGGFFPPTPVTVTGIVVFPSLGPFAADRVGAGTGMLLPERLLRDMAEREGFGDPSDLATFVGVELRPDAAPDAVARLSAELAPLDLDRQPCGHLRGPGAAARAGRPHVDALRRRHRRRRPRRDGNDRAGRSIVGLRQVSPARPRRPTHAGLHGRSDPSVGARAVGGDRGGGGRDRRRRSGWWSAGSCGASSPTSSASSRNRPDRGSRWRSSSPGPWSPHCSPPSCRPSWRRANARPTDLRTE